MRLTIVIPALNEEQAIASIIERCLAARVDIVARSNVSDVEIIVVSDGSTDRTAEIAARYVRQESSVRLIVFEENRGYGAAIKRGFEESDSELVGFLDADGTCDPAFFATLCHAIENENASVALGSRMGANSEMPRLRRIGNRFYAFVLSLLSNRMVTDTASGMRVVRRDVLPRLYPLPDGLNFTPAMSARVLMDPALTLVEIPMPYAERIGESKLHVVRDGVRFLRTILAMMLIWRPTRLFAGLAVICTAMMVLFAMHPIETWLRSGRLQEDVIYRLLFCSFLGTVAASLFSATAISDHVYRLMDGEPHTRTFVSSVVDRVYSTSGVVILLLPAIVVVGLLIGEGVWSWASLGRVDQHWSRAVLAGMIAYWVSQLAVAVMVVNVLRFHSARRTIESTRTIEKTRSAPVTALVRNQDPAPVTSRHQDGSFISSRAQSEPRAHATGSWAPTTIR